MIKRVIAFMMVLCMFFQTFIPLVSVQAASMTDTHNHWAKNEIEALVQKGIISGYEDGTFKPNAVVTRGQFVAFLVRALDLPEGSSSFKDVSKNSKLYKEISAAKRAGILQGTLDGYAHPNQSITRADAAAMIDRSMQLKGSYEETADLHFADSNEVPKYAKESISRMVYYKIILGTNNNRVEAKAVVTRAQAAVFIYRMLDVLNLDDETATIKAPGNAVNLSSSEIQVPLGDGNNVRIKMNNTGVPLTYIKKSKVAHIRSTDYHYDYHLGNAQNPLGSFRLTLRRLDNGDTFIFTKFVHNGNNNYSASIILPFQDVERTRMQRIDQYGKVNQDHNPTFGVNPTSHPIGLLDIVMTNQGVKSLMLSKNYTSVQRQQVYNNNQKSVIREFKEEYENVKTNLDKDNKTLSVSLNMKVTSKMISESWVLLSNEKLFQQQKYVDYWFEKSVLEFESLNSWYTAEGPYTKLPWSIEPGYKMGFGRNLGQVQGGVYLTAYKGSKERYFYNLVVNAIADLDVFSNGALYRGEVPVFETEYTSTWLKKSYGTTAPYIDTRHNENTALFLKNASDTLGISQLADSNRVYADFLVKQKEIGNIIRVTPSAHLIADYYAPGSKITHVSLNHALGEMKFLLETYKSTNQEIYLKTARELRAAIEHLHPRWIRDNGDLWYQVDGNLHFSGNDYPWLTLADLLQSQQIFREVGLSRSKIFDEMIVSKTNYLVKENQPIKQLVINLLKQEGFGYLVEGYPNIVSESETEDTEAVDVWMEYIYGTDEYFYH